MAEMKKAPITPFSEKKDKIAVNYRNCEKCQMCDFFDGVGGCRSVEGSISPEGVCNLWQIRSALPTYKDGQFYLEEYKKSTKG